MSILTRWMTPLLLAAGIGAAALPAPAQAQDDLTRVLVDIADVVLRGDTPYYRHGDYGDDDRLYMQRDRYGQQVYYRNAKCNKHGKCKAEYYSPHHDRDLRNRYVRDDRRQDRDRDDDWDDRRGRRGRDDDDDDD